MLSLRAREATQREPRYHKERQARIMGTQQPAIIPLGNGLVPQVIGMVEEGLVRLGSKLVSKVEGPIRQEALRGQQVVGFITGYGSPRGGSYVRGKCVGS